jgi:ribonucleoside-diphosphate reductase alpha chain
VIGLHKEYANRVETMGVPEDLLGASRDAWSEALDLGRRSGYRNAQVTVVAPTGTIAFMMDCDTTGIEPDIALVKYKQLVGGGMLKIVNNTVSGALANHGYSQDAVADIVAYIDETDTIEGAPHLKAEHLSIFDCAFPSARGSRSIHYKGHIKMMAAAQPFLSGGISKTVNLPSDCGVDDISEAYLEGWRLGLKSLAVYRDGSKRTQPLNTSLGAHSDTDAVDAVSADPEKSRRKLPDVRESLTHKFSIAGHDGYLTVGHYEDGTPGEIWLKMAKEGSTISGLMDSLAIMTSLALQYGVPLKALVDKFSHTRFEPSGFTENRELPLAKSVTDYVFRWLGLRYGSTQESLDDGLAGEGQLGDGLDQPGGGSGSVVPILRGGAKKDPVGVDARVRAVRLAIGQQDAPPCMNCGSIMVRAGACYACATCGETGGCG